MFLLLILLGMAACREGAYAEELDFMVSEKITMAADGSSPQLQISQLMIENNTAATYLEVDEIAVGPMTETWALVPESTDFVNLASDSCQVSLSAEDHDFSNGAYYPQDLQISPGNQIEVFLSGKTGAVTDALEDVCIGSLTVTVSPAGMAVPKGCTYKIYKTGETRNPGDLMPPTAGKNDTFTTGDYKYTMDAAGWKVAVLDKTKAKYEAIRSFIADFPVYNMDGTFRACSQMVRSPEIPASVTEMDYTFYNCKLLELAPELPPNVRELSSTFYGCAKLSLPPEIPDGVTKMDFTFSSCSALTCPPDLPDSVTNLSSAFSNCPLLAEAPEIPYGVTTMKSTFQNCKALLYPPELPETVTDLYYSFYGCKNLLEAPQLPQGAENLNGMFYMCSKITDAPVIPPSAVNVGYMFFNCSSLTGTITIHAEPKEYNLFLAGTGNALVIDGSCSDEMKALLAATATNGNVTWIPAAVYDEIMEVNPDEVSI